MFDSLANQGFQTEYQAHAEAILEVDFPQVATELEEVLLGATIPIEEIIASGGGEAKGTQRLRRGLASKGWKTRIFTIEKRIDGVPKEAISHKVDHVRTFKLADGKDYTIALEIEWNNKDPFFDRDLENFKRLHADGAISLGVIITRGKSLHESMRDLVRRFCHERQISSFEQLLEWGYDPTRRQRAAIQKRVARTKNPLSFAEAFVSTFVSDKFGEATTHWRKLEERVQRGVGNPCPLVLIGLPVSIVTFGEDKTTVKALIEDAQGVDSGEPAED